MSATGELLKAACHYALSDPRERTPVQRRRVKIVGRHPYKNARGWLEEEFNFPPLGRMGRVSLDCGPTVSCTWASIVDCGGKGSY